MSFYRLVQAKTVLSEPTTECHSGLSAAKSKDITKIFIIACEAFYLFRIVWNNVLMNQVYMPSGFRGVTTTV